MVNNNVQSPGLFPIVVLVTLVFAAGLSIAYFTNAADLRMFLH